MSTQRPELPVDFNNQSYRYYRNAVERHWDPFDIDLEQDKKALKEFGEQLQEEEDTDQDQFKRSIAMFGAGEEAVTEDLAPLTVVLDDIEDQMYVTTQIYEESKHTEFFNRYWREVINELEKEQGEELTSPLEDRWFNDSYHELFQRNEDAMHLLLEEDTLENRVRAFCHYHLTIEGILAQTGYYGLQKTFGPDEYPEVPHLPGLYEGLSFTRQDEGRHVGFGMSKIKEFLSTGEVGIEVVEETVNELLPLIQGIVDNDDYDDLDIGMEDGELIQYSVQKHSERMDQIRRFDEELPSVDKLTALD